MTLNVLKKRIWYPCATKPPRHVTRTGSITLLLLTGEHFQEGYYSHEEDKYYAKVQRYLPRKFDFDVVRSVADINQALEWDTEEVNPEAWMIIDIPGREEPCIK